MPTRITRDRIARWGLGSVYALRSEEGTWYNYPIRFPVYLIDKNGYLMIQTEEDLVNNPCVVISPRRDGSRLIRFTLGPGTGERSISELPGYVRKG